MKREEALQTADQALLQLKESLAQGESKQMQQYLAFMARFHKYSFGNILLILSQRPEATFVAGFKTWLKMGRAVRKGEKGICILAPMQFKKEANEGKDDEKEGVRICFRAVHVFDVSQTDGDELPEPAQVTGDPAEKMAALETVIGNHGIVLREDFLGDALGVSLKGEIVIRPGLEPAERFAVLAHEACHEILHDSQTRKSASKKVKETEAEAVAFVVCAAFGLDTTVRSSDYIFLYEGDGETLSDSLERIQKTASLLIEEISQIVADGSFIEPASHPTSAGDRSSVAVPSAEAHHMGDVGMMASELPVDSGRDCQHMLYHTDKSGKLLGSWHAVSIGDQVRIECRKCGKFFSYLVEQEESEESGPLESPPASDHSLVSGVEAYDETCENSPETEGHHDTFC